ncbi:hypothetical protein [Caulobacter sp.]|uniref:hypothetical protein n=1 Tax=Caulobacter sp. TaxID=78 RepID=UPI001B2020F5|nr:hypothetical protein [Caulobacter sp.]MBO9543397.1 hypothetical protein [Caulobacter sp.]
MAATSRRSADALGLAGDGDDLDLITTIEDSFGLRFGDETAQWTTVGELHEALVGQIAPTAAAGRCATSMAFYRLRAALTRLATPASPITPRTRLEGLARITPNRLLAALRRELGVDMPSASLSARGEVGLLLLLAGLAAVPLAIAVHPLWPSLALLPVGWVMVRHDPGWFGEMSVGDLARVVALRNFNHFAALGADSRPDAVWRTLCALIEEETGRAAKSIRPDTRFY